MPNFTVVPCRSTHRELNRPSGQGPLPARPRKTEAHWNDKEPGQDDRTSELASDFRHVPTPDLASRGLDERGPTNFDLKLTPSMELSIQVVEKERLAESRSALLSGEAQCDVYLTGRDWNTEKYGTVSDHALYHVVWITSHPHNQRREAWHKIRSCHSILPCNMLLASQLPSATRPYSSVHSSQQMQRPVTSGQGLGRSWIYSTQSSSSFCENTSEGHNHESRIPSPASRYVTLAQSHLVARTAHKGLEQASDNSSSYTQSNEDYRRQRAWRMESVSRGLAGHLAPASDSRNPSKSASLQPCRSQISIHEDCDSDSDGSVGTRVSIQRCGSITPRMCNGQQLQALDPDDLDPSRSHISPESDVSMQDRFPQGTQVATADQMSYLYTNSAKRERALLGLPLEREEMSWRRMQRIQCGQPTPSRGNVRDPNASVEYDHEPLVTHRQSRPHQGSPVPVDMCPMASQFARSSTPTPLLDAFRSMGRTDKAKALQT